jgi:hypothetical protein
MPAFLVAKVDEASTGTGEPGISLARNSVMQMSEVASEMKWRMKSPQMTGKW